MAFALSTIQSNRCQSNMATFPHCLYFDWPEAVVRSSLQNHCRADALLLAGFDLDNVTHSISL